MKSISHIILIAAVAIFALHSCGSNGEAKTNCKIDTNETYIVKDSIIKVPVYEFSGQSNTQQLIDSTVLYNAFPSMTLFCYDDLKKQNTISLYHRLLKLDEFRDVVGVYYSTDNTPVYIFNIEAKLLLDIGLKRTEKQATLNYREAFPEIIDTYPLGYNIQFTPKSDSTTAFGMGYNAQNFLDDSIAAKKYACFFNPSEAEAFMQEANNKQRKRDKRYNQYLINKAQGIGQDIKVNTTCDTIFSTLNYGLFRDQVKDSTFVLPVYKFDSTFEGNILSNICDTIAKYNIFSQLWIGPASNSIEKSKILIHFNTISLYNREDITGVILNDAKNVPIFLKDFTPELQKMYGISKTNQQILVYLRADVNCVPLDALGYYAWISKPDGGRLKINLEFDGRPIDAKTAKLFEWMFDY